MIAAEIAAVLGGAHRSGPWWRCLCPVHGSRTGRSATLALRNGDRSIVAYCHGGCDPRDVQAELRRRGLLGAGDRSFVTDRLPRGDGDDHCDRARRIEIARRLWSAARDARRSPLVRHLAGRGITVDPPPSLRWAPRCWHGKADRCVPAMVGAIADAAGKTARP